MHHPVVTGVLLGLAVALTIACAAGMALMRDAFQRLHFSAPVVSLGVALITVAVWIEDADAQARIKVILIAVVLFITNGILTHATARAFYVRRTGHFEVSPEDGVTVIGRAGDDNAPPPAPPFTPERS